MTTKEKAWNALGDEELQMLVDGKHAAQQEALDYIESCRSVANWPGVDEGREEYVELHGDILVLLRLLAARAVQAASEGQV